MVEFVSRTLVPTADLVTLVILPLAVCRSVRKARSVTTEFAKFWSSSSVSIPLAELVHRGSRVRTAARG
jgi:hypothetical protein